MLITVTDQNQSEEILRSGKPAATDWKGRLSEWAVAHMDLGFKVLRNLRPIATFRSYALVTRFDDVQEVLSRSEVFVTPYKPKLDVIMGGIPFFLGMTDTSEHARDLAAMTVVLRRSDIAPRLTSATEARSSALVAAANGRIEVVDMVRTITFDVLCAYFGIPGPPDADMRVWATRLFEFQFADPDGDPKLRTEVDRIAPLLRQHVDGVIERRMQGEKADDLLGRCLALQAADTPGVDNEHIRTNLLGLIVGGLPQPPLVLPQAMEQILRRPEVLAEAISAARNNDDARLASLIFEALRFDPLAPALPRIAAEDYVLAAGTWRARKIAKGTTVLASVRSAMRDGRRVPHAERFDAGRAPYQYMHFGYGMHSCFFMHINLMLLPLMLKPLLQKGNIQRAQGVDGHLTKRGIFPDRLVVTFG